MALGLDVETRQETALRQAVHQLKREDPLPGENEPLSFLQPADKPDLLGLLGPYEVQEEVGRGGMGVVLKARDPALNRVVAIKVMAQSLAHSATARRRFVREGRAAAAVRHDHIVAVHGVNEAGGLPYLVMQYIAGESLQGRLDRQGPLPLVEIVRIGHQTAAALAAAHAQGLIHRDIKPANILLQKQESGRKKDEKADGTSFLVPPCSFIAKITDFGLARMADDVPLTQAGVLAGTPEYMAPEQARGEPIDHRVDLFSLGSVLYAMATGSPPFHASTPLAVLRRVSDAAPAPVRSVNPHVPAWLEALIVRLLAKDPAERFQSAAKVAALLEGYLSHLRQPATVPPPDLPVPLADGSLGQIEAELRPGGVKRYRHGLWPWALVPLALLGLLFFLVPQATLPGGGLSEQLIYDFRGRPLPPDLVPFGPLEDRFVKVEAEGLRITLPSTRSDYVPVGFSKKLAIAGDFEISAAFDLLQADVPVPGVPSYGTGLLMSVNEAARVGRLVRAQGKSVVTWDRWARVQGNRKFLTDAAPCTVTAGRLGLKRTGTVLHFLIAPEHAGENFEDVHQCEFGADDITLLRLELNTNAGRRPGTLDIRLVDFKIRSNTPAADQSSTAEEGSTTGSKGWLAAAGILGLVILLSLVLGWAIRQRRATAKAPARLLAKQAQTDVAAPANSLRCSGCGRILRTRPELAGKRVKCPHCGTAVVVAGEQTH
jgi:serine/threonine protein kinase